MADIVQMGPRALLGIIPKPYSFNINMIHQWVQWVLQNKHSKVLLKSV
jgi:hypothetical protein